MKKHNFPGAQFGGDINIQVESAGKEHVHLKNKINKRTKVLDFPTVRP